MKLVTFFSEPFKWFTRIKIRQGIKYRKFKLAFLFLTRETINKRKKTKANTRPIETKTTGKLKPKM